MSSTERAVIPSSPRIFDIPTLLFLLAALLFLYPFFFASHFIPIDQGVCGAVSVLDGKRMYEGEVMYRDFFQFLPPATALAYYFLFKLFGLRLWILNAECALLALGLAWLGVMIARKLTHPSLVFLPSAIFLVGLYQNHLDSLHHWHSLLTATAGIAVLMERRTPARIAAAGFWGALSVCFIQARGLGVTTGFAAFLWWESRQRGEDWRALVRREAWLIASFLATLIAVNGYFVWKAGLGRFLWCTVAFGVKYYPKDAQFNTFKASFLDLPKSITLRSFIPKQWLFLNAVLPLTCILFFARYWRESSRKTREFWERPMLLALTSAGMFLSVAPAPALHRLATSGLPAINLLVWFMDSPRKLARVLTVFLVAGVLLVAVHAVAGTESRQRWILTTRQGKIALESLEEYEWFTWVQQHTRPSEYFYDPTFGACFCLNLRNPTPMWSITNNGYTTPEQAAEVIQGLERHHVRYVSWSPSDVDIIPEWENPSEDHLGPLREYIHSHYRLVRVFANSDEIWERED